MYEDLTTARVRFFSLMKSDTRISKLWTRDGTIHFVWKDDNKTSTINNLYDGGIFLEYDIADVEYCFHITREKQPFKCTQKASPKTEQRDNKIRSLGSGERNSWVFHMNVRSINFHFEELQVLVASFKVLPVAICLTETWGNQVDDTDSLLLNKYQKTLHISRINKNSGVFIYFHEDYSVKEIPVETTVENLTYKLSRESDQFILSCIYNAPAVGVKKFIADMETILTFQNEY